MTQIKARFAGKASASLLTPLTYVHVGNGHPLARAAKLPRPAIAPDLRPCRPRPSWGILDVPNPLNYKGRPKRALAWTALSKLVVDDYSGVWMPCHASARFGCVPHNHPSS
jgi:hypothetical protein